MIAPCNGYINVNFSLELENLHVCHHICACTVHEDHCKFTSCDCGWATRLGQKRHHHVRLEHCFRFLSTGIIACYHHSMLTLVIIIVVYCHRQWCSVFETFSIEILISLEVGKCVIELHSDHPELFFCIRIFRCGVRGRPFLERGWLPMGSLLFAQLAPCGCIHRRFLDLIVPVAIWS